MKHILYIFLIIPSFVFAQQGVGKMEYREATPDDIVVCPHSHSHDPYYSPRKEVAKKLKNNAAQFVPNYSASVPTDFRDAMDFVFETASGFISSKVPIYVDVDYSALDDGILGQAGATGFISNFPGALYVDTEYPIALAEKLAGEDINRPGSPDISIEISSRIDWNTTPDSVEIGSKFDLATVMLHELIHGLGFIAGSIVTSENIGFLSPFIFSRFIENGNTVNLLDGIENPSENMQSQLTGGRLFFKNTEKENEKYRLFAPATYNNGSSISHLDRSIYQGTEHRLMISQLGRGDVNYNPGFSATILSLMGWNSTSLLHEQESLVEKDVNEDFLVNALINSDIGFDTSSLVLHYSTDSFNLVDNIVSLDYDADKNNYSFLFEGPQEDIQYQYYFEFKEISGRTQLVPARADEFFFTHNWGNDKVAPVIAGHVPVESIKETDTEITFNVNDINDFFTGVDTSSLALVLSLNGVLDTIPFELTVEQFATVELIGFEATYPKPDGFSNDDMLSYKIIIFDTGVERNQGSLPAEGFFDIEIQEVAEAVVTYVNDFDVESSDFSGSGFRITAPAGFSSPAIHSEHPYRNAGEGKSLNFIYNLAQLITIDADNPIIRFDEIVLVETGDPGTSCRGAICPASFWDYVVVEGNKLGSSEWIAFHDAYDSRDNSAFLSAYNAQRNGSPSLYRPKEISLIENGSFDIGDEIFIRFRLFSDPFAVGWGWAIDNLEIQPMSTNTLEEEYVNTFKLYPNPIGKDQILSIDINLNESLTGQLSLINIQGQKLIDHKITNSRQVNVNWDLSSLTQGIYFAQLQNELGTSVRKIIVE